MKKIIFLFFTLFFSVSLAQESYNVEPFSSFRFGISAGSNFQTIKFPGSSLLLEVKTPLTNNLVLKLSGGFSQIFEDKSFDMKYNKLISIDGIERYGLNTDHVKKIEHTLFPVYAGLEYTFIDNKLSPYALLDIGYAYCSSKSIIVQTGILVETEEEIPGEYQNPVPQLRKTRSIWGAGVGAGLKYKLSGSLEILLTYVFRYNDEIVNSHNILLGISL